MDDEVDPPVIIIPNVVCQPPLQVRIGWLAT